LIHETTKDFALTLEAEKKGVVQQFVGVSAREDF